MPHLHPPNIERDETETESYVRTANPPAGRHLFEW